MRNVVVDREALKINGLLVLIGVCCYIILCVVFTLISLGVGVANNLESGLIYATKITIFFVFLFAISSLLFTDRLGYYLTWIIATSIIISACAVSLLRLGLDAWYVFFLIISFLFPCPPEVRSYAPRKQFLKKLREFLLTMFAIKTLTALFSFFIFRFIYNAIT